MLTDDNDSQNDKNHFMHSPHLRETIEIMNAREEEAAAALNSSKHISQNEPISNVGSEEQNANIEVKSKSVSGRSSNINNR